MATASVQKKLCCKCDKGGGVFTCDGCQQSFCRKHTDEHRQDLSVQMDKIEQEHDVFQRDLNKEMDLHPLLSRIDEWERESISKIQQVAKQARVDLRKLIEQNKQDLKTSMNQLTSELQTSRDSEDYTELDFKRWIDQLNELRNEVEKPLAFDVIDDDDNRSIIRLIKVYEQLDSHSPNRSTLTSNQINRDLSKSIEGISEKFEQMDTRNALSENGLLVTCLNTGIRSDSTVHGIRCYSSDMHYVRFRIEQKNSRFLFFGIMTKDQAISGKGFAAPSANGWFDFDYYMKDGLSQGSPFTVTIKTGDEVTLVLDCDHRQIHFKHHRTQRSVKMSIDLQKYPFPWQILVTLNSKGDCVRILDNNGSS